MNAHMDLQLKIARRLLPDHLAEAVAAPHSRLALRPPARDAGRQVFRGLTASYARAVPFAGVELIEQQGRS